MDQRNIGGRPRKVTLCRAKQIAEQWWVIKRREPRLTQKEYAKHNGVSDRCLRHYLKKYTYDEMIAYWEENLEKRKRPQSKYYEDEVEDDDVDVDCTTDLLIAWT